MIHPTRTNLLQMRDRQRSVAGSVTILQARRQALIREFLRSSQPFLQSRQRMRHLYREAIDHLHLSIGQQGEESLAALSAVADRNLSVTIEQRNILGVKYLEVDTPHDIQRPANRRGYDMGGSSPHLEDAVDLFEKLLDTLVEIGRFESKLKRLGDEIVRLTRRTRVLEERILPGLADTIKVIDQYIGEREREGFFRLKRFKNVSSRESTF